jgi:signal peptidase I
MLNNPRSQPARKQNNPPLANGESTLESIASLLCTAITLLFAMTFVFQNFVIPSASMASTILVGDHVVADRASLAPRTNWMDHLLPYRDLRRGEPVVFLKPVLESDGTNLTLVKRVVGIPGDRIHLRDGILYLNGIAQNEPQTAKPTALDHDAYRDNFPAVSPDGIPHVTATWALDLPTHIQNGDLVVPPDNYFVMGDNRTNSLDGRYWGFVHRENLIGRPLFIYWSFAMHEQDGDPTTTESLTLTLHELTHFLTETRWTRTLQRIN